MKQPIAFQENPAVSGPPTQGSALEDPIQYLEYKILLNPTLFAAHDAFHQFWKRCRRTADEVGVELTKPDEFEAMPREVLFHDTPRYRLYNNAFILRRRIFYEHGMPLNTHELTLKFRHQDRAVAAAVNVHPQIDCRYKIKFKEEILLSIDKVGGMRSIFSHGCVMTLDHFILNESFESVVRVFPVLATIGAKPTAALSVVNNLAIEESLVGLGVLDFGHHVTAKADVGVWRNRLTQELLTAEFAYQIKFDRLENLDPKVRQRSDAFYRDMQLTLPNWLQMGTTKTAKVYGAGKAPVRNRE